VIAPVIAPVIAALIAPVIAPLIASGRVPHVARHGSPTI
jgi:hypothetical protein